MNYRHKLLTSQSKNQISQLEQEWQLERQNLQQDIINLQNSTDSKLIEQSQQEIRKLEEEIENNQVLITEKDHQIKQLEKFPPRLELYQQKVNNLEKNLLNLAKQKLTGKKEAERLLKDLETRWKEWEAIITNEREEEKEQWSQNLAQKDKQIQEAMKNWLETKEALEEKIATLSNDNDKLNEENNKLTVDKSNLNKQVLNLTKGEQALNHRIEEIEKEHLKKLRKINAIFDENALHYETIDFNNLYNILQKGNYKYIKSLATISDLEDQLENTQKLVSTDKKDLVDQAAQKDWQLANCQKTAEEAKKIVDSFLVRFVGKDKVLDYLNQIIELNYD